MGLPIKEKIARHLMTFEGRTLRLGVGCAPIGRTEETYREMLRQDVELLMASYEAGFRYYDTSRAYGTSELAVGEFLRHIPRESIYLATKAQFNRFRSSTPFQDFKDHFEQSFERLGVDHIDCYQIHDTDHYLCCEEEVIPFLKEQQSKGRISYIGMGTRSLNALELGVRGELNSVLSYLQYSILKKSAEPLIDVCDRRGAAFVNASVLHFGIVKAENPMEVTGRTTSAQMRLRATCARMQEVCRKHGIPILAPALQFTLLNPKVDISLNGLARMSNLTSTLEALRVPIWPEQWAEIFAVQNAQPYIDIQDDLY